MSGRRGRVLGMESAGGDLQTVTVMVPLAEVTTYARSLSSMTGGQGSYTMEFSHYDVVPGNVQKSIIEKAVLEKEEEEEIGAAFEPDCPQPGCPTMASHNPNLRNQNCLNSPIRSRRLNPIDG